MFVSKDKPQTKRSFQKPNILRRKQKVLKKIVTESPISPATENQVTQIKNGESYDKDCTLLIPKKSPQIVVPNSDSKVIGFDFNVFETNTPVNNNDKYPETIPLNIESFLNNGAIEQNATSESQSEIQTPTWCFVLNNYEGSQLSSTEEQSPTGLNTATIVIPEQEPSTSQELSTVISDQNLLTESSRPVKLKCDEPNCNKGFWSEQKLKAHKNGHKRQGSRCAPAAVECPVKRAGGCGRVFRARPDLLDHLSRDHTLDDALYTCEQCGRRFFWAIGLRAHSAGRCGRGELQCGWPGCQRAFRQPCRLREHARAHTGDRPYPCTHPNCGWSFRSASKLMRHARRHTGERQHQCGACGRAFRRREHLRDHAARHHAAATACPCTHPGCEETFKSTNALCLHMKKVHKKVMETPDSEYLTPESEHQGDNMFVVNLVAETPAVDSAVENGVEECAESEVLGVSEESGASGVSGVSGASGGHAARTHCTWPLRSAPTMLDVPSATTPPVSPAYVLEEDVQVEQSEGSENNIYTIRSDLFLHGNVLINEDSEFVISRELVSRSSGAADDDSQLDLDLIDSHPTIDLMQEELMYGDAAVDESSFRVFLMNGEELA